MQRYAYCKPSWKSQCSVVPAPSTCSHPPCDVCDVCATTSVTTTTPLPNFLSSSSADYIGDAYVVPSSQTPGLAFVPGMDTKASGSCYAEIEWQYTTGKHDANAATWYADMERYAGVSYVEASREDFQRMYKCNNGKAAQCNDLGMDFPHVCSRPPCDSCEPSSVAQNYTRGALFDRTELMKTLLTKIEVADESLISSNPGLISGYKDLLKSGERLGAPLIRTVPDDATIAAAAQSPPLHVQKWNTTVDVMYNTYLFFNNFRNGVNGQWIDHASGSYWPASAATQASCAAAGYGLMTDAIAAELGLLSRRQAEARATQTLKNLLLKWRRDPYHGFFEHFLSWASTSPQTLVTTNSEYSTIDTAIMTAGAVFAGNYFGGSVQDLAIKLYQLTDFTRVTVPGPYEQVKSHQSSPCGFIWMVSDGVDGTMSAPISLPYNEYLVVSYWAGLKSRDRSGAAAFPNEPASSTAFTRYPSGTANAEAVWGSEHGKDGGRAWRHWRWLFGVNNSDPASVPQSPWGEYNGPTTACLTDAALPCSSADGSRWWNPSFTAQFPWFLARGYHDNRAYAENLHPQYMRMDMSYSYDLMRGQNGGDPVVWGKSVLGKLWGNGAGGATPSFTKANGDTVAADGYNVVHLNDNYAMWLSLPIMGGYLAGAEAADALARRDPVQNRYASNGNLPDQSQTTYRDFVNSQLQYLWENDICTYAGTSLGGLPAKTVGWCSPKDDLNTWRDTRPTSVDFATFVLGFATNFLPQGWFLLHMGSPNGNLEAPVLDAAALAPTPNEVVSAAVPTSRQVPLAALAVLVCLSVLRI